MPFRAISIGLFLLLLAACEDSGTDAPVLPYPGTYDAIILYNHGDTLELVLEYENKSIAQILSPNRPEIVADPSRVQRGYDEQTRKGTLTTSGGIVAINYSYTFDGQSMTGPMSLKHSHTLPKIDLDTTVTFVRR